MKRHLSRWTTLIAFLSVGLLVGGACWAGAFGWVGGGGQRETTASAGVTTENYDGRELLVYVPPNLAGRRARALVVVLHGGLGNAARIEGGASEKGLKMDEVAEKNGFLVTYLNGTPVTKMRDAEELGWNAGGGCCGVPAENNVDDVGYITGAVHYLVGKYGVDPQRVYGMGHSNGAMMTLRVMCETGLYAAAVSVSGPLNLKVQDCPAARGKRILAIHGAEDENVPIAGGQGTKGLARVAYNSENYTQQIFSASGADFHLQIVQGADHKLDNISERIQQSEGVSLAQKAARFFGLGK
jgi:polyhydroxybutyrate depolymerase